MWEDQRLSMKHTIDLVPSCGYWVCTCTCVPKAQRSILIPDIFFIEYIYDPKEMLNPPMSLAWPALRLCASCAEQTGANLWCARCQTRYWTPGYLLEGNRSAVAPPRPT